MSAPQVEPDRIVVFLDRNTNMPSRVEVNGEEIPQGNNGTTRIDYDPAKGELTAELTLTVRGRVEMRVEHPWHTG